MFDMESVRVALATASAGPVTPARDGRGRVPCEKPAYGRLSAAFLQPALPRAVIPKRPRSRRSPAGLADVR